MYYKKTEFWYEGLVRLTKDEVIKKLQGYIEDPDYENEFESLEGAIEYLCEEGYFDLGHGYITLTSEYDGCDFDDWDKIR